MDSSRTRTGLKLAPLIIAGLFILFQFVGSERYTNPETGKTEHVGMSRGQESALGLQAYEEVLSTSQVIDSGPQYEEVKKVAGKLAAQTGEGGKDFNWAVSLVNSEQVNAFCLPGGKIVVYTGILPVARDEAGLATVLGHEIAHATARHGAQRVFRSQLAQTALMGAAVSMSNMDYQKRNTIMGLLGAGAQYGVLLPFSRDQESEADEIGLLYMARAGYDPRESLEFWQRMSQIGGSQPPEYLSTHPSHGTRIERLKAYMPKAVAEYEKRDATQADTR